MSAPHPPPSPGTSAVPNATSERANAASGPTPLGIPAPSVRRGPSAAIVGGCVAIVVAVAAVAWFALRGDQPSVADRKTVMANGVEFALRGGEPSATLRVAGVEFALRWCPAGGAGVPAKGFWMGETEVTQAQWEVVMGRSRSEFKGPNNPVEWVSQNNCEVFLAVLNSIPEVEKSGLAFRLSTGEEWKYACRAGATGDYCKLADGTEITEDTLDRVAWFEDNSDETTHPVGLKEPNAFGLYDMHGNVWEWTSDGQYCYTLRGGGWHSSARDCESSWGRGAVGLLANSIGFRLCASGRAD